KTTSVCGSASAVNPARSARSGSTFSENASLCSASRGSATRAVSIDVWWNPAVSVTISTRTGSAACARRAARRATIALASPATLPQTEIGSDAAAIKDYAQAVEGMGYDYILAFDHVVGASPNRPGWGDKRRPYTYESTFHEPFVLFGYLAAVTQRVGLVTGVI